MVIIFTVFTHDDEAHYNQTLSHTDKFHPLEVHITSIL